MELLIRSQDKESITKVSNIQYHYHNDLHIIGTYYDNLKVLGKYKTKEKALEVLNEIQEAQLGNYHYKCPSNVKVSNNGNTIVYEMPKEVK